jgi:hypothetical protein
MPNQKPHRYVPENKPITDNSNSQSEKSAISNPKLLLGAMTENARLERENQKDIADPNLYENMLKELSHRERLIQENAHIGKLGLQLGNFIRAAQEQIRHLEQKNKNIEIQSTLVEGDWILVDHPDNNLQIEQYENIVDHMIKKRIEQDIKRYKKNIDKIVNISNNCVEKIIKDGYKDKHIIDSYNKYYESCNKLKYEVENDQNHKKKQAMQDYAYESYRLRFCTKVIAIEADKIKSNEAWAELIYNSDLDIRCHLNYILSNGKFSEKDFNKCEEKYDEWDQTEMSLYQFATPKREKNKEARNNALKTCQKFGEFFEDNRRRLDEILYPE